MRNGTLFIAGLLVLSFFSTALCAEVDVEYRKALKCYHTKKFDKAAEILKKYVEAKPDPSAYYLLGYSLYELGRHKEAREYFDQAYLIDADFSLEKAGLLRKSAVARAVK